MHQPLTIAKVRKEQTIKVKPGDWVILVSPDEPFSTHAEKRRVLISKGLASDDYETLAVGRMDNKYADVNFYTEKEKKAVDAQAAEANAVAAKAAKESEDRQAKIDATEREKLAAAHAAKVAAINVENDRIRNRSI